MSSGTNCNCELEVPRLPTMKFVGIGYNLLSGNPEGSVSLGGVDPGLRDTHRVLQLTYNTNRMTHDRSYSLPDQVNFAERLSCTASQIIKSYTGTKSYQGYLRSSVDGSASYSGLFSYSFSTSARYKDVQKRYLQQREIFVEKQRTCNRGTFRYERERASSRADFKLADGFAAAVRALPSSYTRSQYGRFLDEWGTHVVTQITVGSKYIEHFQSSFQEAYTYALNQYAIGVSGSASSLSFSGSISLNVDHLVTSSSSTSLFKSAYKVTAIGSTIYWDRARNQWVFPLRPEMKEPIAIAIRPITEFLSSAYTTDTHILSRARGLSTALYDYASYRRALPGSDGPLTALIVWPKGNYGLVQPTSGCPSNSWNIGYRHHDTEDDGSNNQWSSGYSLAGYKGRNNMKWEFCMKLFTNAINYQWPKGQYCILKKNNCPSGFHYGNIYWDDEDDDNANSAGGTLPDGSYNSNTRIDFCCRKDGDPERVIVLPTSKPFILVKATDKCQKVSGMTASHQWFRWDDEDDNNSDSRGGMSPYDTGGSNNHKLNFCYYT